MKDKNKTIKLILNEIEEQGILEAMGEGISIQDTNYRVVYQNQIHKNFVGEHIGEFCYKAYEKKEQVCDDCPVAMAFKDGKTHTEERSAPTERGIAYYEITASPLKDITGKIIAGIEVARDITEKKRAEQLHEKHVKRLGKLYELSMMLSGDPIDIFQSSARMIGELLDVRVVCLSEIRGDELFFISVYVDGEVMTDVGSCPLSITPCATVQKSKDIRVFDHVATMFPEASFLKMHNAFSYCGFPSLNSTGDVNAVTCLLDDKPHDFSENDRKLLQIFGQRIGLEIERQGNINKHKKGEEARECLNEKLKQKNKELEQIVYVTSHDLRSPLINIDGYSTEIGNSLEDINNLLQNEEVPTEIKEKITAIIKNDISVGEQFISNNITKMSALLAGLLHLSRIGSIEIKKEKLDMNSVLSEINNSLSFELQEANAKLEISELPSCICDKTQVSQIFSNLIGNAIKNLNPKRPGIIKVSGDKEDGRLVYCVEDNGIGIAPEHHKKIFDIFYRLNPSKYIGDGLGLTIIQKILYEHDGKIWLESEVGKGSKFFVSLNG